MKRRPKEPDVVALIAAEISKALQRYDADEELLAIIGSWRDTLEDHEILQLLREFNATGRVLHTPQ